MDTNIKVYYMEILLLLLLLLDYGLYSLSNYICEIFFDTCGEL